MFKSDEEVELMLGHRNNGARVVGIGNGNSIGSHAGAKVEHISRTTAEKSDIAVLGTLLGTTAAAPLMGVTPSRVRLYKAGSNGRQIDEDLRAENASRLGTIRTKAIDKVELFMEMLSKDKAIKMRGKDMASAAEKFVNIFDKLGPKVPGSNTNVQIIFHAPRVLENKDYPILNVEAVVES